MGSAAPIDHRHLARYTLGNRALEVDVLHLFADQAPLTLADLVGAMSDKAWHMAAHTLKVMGYQTVVSMAGGIEAWKAASLTLVTA